MGREIDKTRVSILMNPSVCRNSPADHVNLLHPLDGSPEEGSAGVAAVAPEVEVVGGGGGAHRAVQHQQRGGAPLLNLSTLTLHQYYLNLSSKWINAVHCKILTLDTLIMLAMSIVSKVYKTLFFLLKS